MYVRTNLVMAMLLVASQAVLSDQRGDAIEIRLGKNGSAETTGNLIALATMGDDQLKKFTALASAADTDGLLQMMTFPKDTDDAAVRETVEKLIVPFFSDFDHMVDTSVARPTKYAYLDNHAGVNFFVFAESKAGERKPFVVGMIEENSKVKIVYVDVGHCVKGVHSSC